MKDHKGNQIQSELSRIDKGPARRLTEYGKDMARVYNDLCAVLHVGYANMTGIEYRITAKGRG